MLNIKNTLDGYLKDVEIKGNTIQDASNLADIRSVGDKVEGQELYKVDVVSRGKNLNNSILELGGLTTSSGLPTDNNVQFRSKDFISVIGNKSVYATINEPNLVIGGFYSYDKNENFISAVAQGKELPENCKYLKIFGRHKVSGTDISSIISDNIKVQLEYGTQATPYEPYQEDKLTILSPAQLEKVGDVADRITCKDGVWGVEKNVKSKILDGSEGWVQNSVGECYLKPFDVLAGSKLICDTLSNDTTQEYYIKVHPYNQEISIKNEASIISSSEIKQYLSKNNILVKYPTTQPQFIPLPHDQQVKLRTFASKTNISFLTEIEGTIKAQVPKSLGATVNTHTEQINNLNKELDRVKKLEESTVSTVETESGFTSVEETSNGYFEDVKLEGRTLVNLLDDKEDKVFNETYLCSDTKGLNLSLFKPNTIYTLISIGLDKVEKTSLCNNKVTEYVYLNKPGKITTFTTPNDMNVFTSPIRVFAYSSVNNRFVEGDEQKIKFIILEGDHTNNPPSYFEGLMSTGEDVDEVSVESVQNMLDFTKLANGATDGTTGVFSPSHNRLSLDVNDRIKLYSQRISVKCNDVFVSIIGFTEKDGNPIYDSGYLALNVINEVSLPSNTNYISVNIKNRHESSISKEDAKNLRIYYQSNKKPLLYYNPTTSTWEKPILREWDSIEKHSDGKYYYHKRSGEVVFNGSEDYACKNYGTNFDGSCISFRVNLKNIVPKNGALCISDYGFTLNSAPTQIGKVFDDEYIYFMDNGNLYFTIQKDKLTSLDNVGVNELFTKNPIKLVFELNQEEVYECTNIDLITYANETNYIVNAGAISPKSILKVHNNISNVVKILQEKVSLLESNIKASQEVQDMMILESDMRILDMELALMEFIPMKLNLGGSDMLRSATYFNFLKNHIVNETYSKEYLENVMNKYLATNRLTQEEYNELYKMLYPPVYDIELPIEY